MDSPLSTSIDESLALSSTSQTPRRRRRLLRARPPVLVADPESPHCILNPDSEVWISPTSSSTVVANSTPPPPSLQKLEPVIVVGGSSTTSPEQRQQQQRFTRPSLRAKRVSFQDRLRKAVENDDPYLKSHSYIPPKKSTIIKHTSSDDYDSDKKQNLEHDTNKNSLNSYQNKTSILSDLDQEEQAVKPAARMYKTFPLALLERHFIPLGRLVWVPPTSTITITTTTAAAAAATATGKEGEANASVLDSKRETDTDGPQDGSPDPAAVLLSPPPPPPPSSPPHVSDSVLRTTTPPPQSHKRRKYNKEIIKIQVSRRIQRILSERKTPMNPSNKVWERKPKPHFTEFDKVH